MIRFLGRLFWPFGRGSERRRERSKRKSTRKGTLPERGQRTARTTDGERSHMFELYEQGLGTHAIAKKTGRSTHTVHSVLTFRGTRSLPERTVRPVPEAGKTRDTKAGKRKPEKGDTAKLSAAQNIEGRLLEKLEPQLERAYGELLREDPAVARQILGSVLGVKISEKTIDDLVMETIAGDQVLRREWAEARLQDIKRNGRSELDIVGEGLELVLKVVQEMEKGAWPRVISEAVTSGELRGTLLGLAGVLKQGPPAAEKGSTDDPISQP
jgi:hypothetical protein